MARFDFAPPAGAAYVRIPDAGEYEERSGVITAREKSSSKTVVSEVVACNGVDGVSVGDSVLLFKGSAHRVSGDMHCVFGADILGIMGEVGHE